MFINDLTFHLERKFIILYFRTPFGCYYFPKPLNFTKNLVTTKNRLTVFPQMLEIRPMIKVMSKYF